MKTMRTSGRCRWASLVFVLVGGLACTQASAQVPDFRRSVLVGAPSGVLGQHDAGSLLQEVVQRCGAAVVTNDAAVWRVPVEEPTVFSDYDWLYLWVSTTPHETSQLAMRRRLDGALFLARLGGPLGLVQRYGPLSDSLSCRPPETGLSFTS